MKKRLPNESYFCWRKRSDPEWYAERKARVNAARRACPPPSARWEVREKKRITLASRA